MHINLSLKIPGNLPKKLIFKFKDFLFFSDDDPNSCDVPTLLGDLDDL